MIDSKTHRITLRGISKKIKNGIKRQAKSNGRSVNIEIIKLIEDSLRQNSIKQNEKIGA
jgi:hypothetical protein